MRIMVFAAFRLCALEGTVVLAKVSHVHITGQPSGCLCHYATATLNIGNSSCLTSYFQLVVLFCSQNKHIGISENKKTEKNKQLLFFKRGHMYL